MTTDSSVKFSLSKRPSSVINGNKKRAQEEEDEKKDIVIGFSSTGELVSATPQKTADGPKVIPLAIQGLTKRSKQTSSDNNDNNKNNNNNNASKNSEASTSEANGNGNGNGNGTHAIKEKTLDELAAEEIIRDALNEGKPDEGDARTVPLTVQNQIEGLEDITDEKERFLYDLASRPDEAGEQEYEDMPIEDFGNAMLRGMGWTPGTAIGLNNKGLVEPIEFVKRAGYRLGLGATPKDIPVKKKKYIKPGESREPAPIMVAAAGPDGKVRHVKGIGEKLVPLKKGLQQNDLVGIVSGPHEGLYARVVGGSGDDDLVVRLESSSEDVIVAKSDVSVVDLSKLSEEHPAYKFMKKERKERERAERENDEKKDKKSSKKSSKSSSEDSSRTWLRPHIMVRVVSKSFENGKYYNKKVRVLDVTGHNECIIQLENGQLVEGVKQRMLETFIPPQGARVMVVEGENRGKIGKLMEKTSGDNGTAIVQLMGDLSIESYSLDNIAYYVGSREEEAVDMSL